MFSYTTEFFKLLVLGLKNQFVKEDQHFPSEREPEKYLCIVLYETFCFLHV